MMKIIFIILALFFVVLLQTTFVPRLALYGVFPNLILLIIILKSAFKDYKKIFIWPLAGGIILDICSGGLPFGVFTLGFLIVSVVVSFLSRNIWSSENTGLVLVLLTILGSLILGFAALFFAKLGYLFMNFSWQAHFGELSVIIFKETIYNVILMLVLLFVIKKLGHKIHTNG